MNFLKKIINRQWNNPYNSRFFIRRLSYLYERTLSTETVNVLSSSFTETFPEIVRNFAEDPEYKQIPDAVKTFKNVLESTVPHGRQFRSFILIHCYKNLEEPSRLTPENLKLAYILAWCTELVRTASVIIDDIIDNSETRRGKKCWHKDVGMRATFDALVLENYCYQVINKYFSSSVSTNLVRLVQDTSFRMALGELIVQNNPDINKFTMKYYQTLVRYKTTANTFELPYNLAMCLANKHKKISIEILTVLVKLGEFFQIQNDYSDCYGNKSQDFKTGNDIQEGKCSWLVVKALEKSNEKQRKILEENYGKNDQHSVDVVKDLYNVLGVCEEYAIYENNMFEFMENNFDLVSKFVCRETVFPRLAKCFKL